MIPLAQQMNPTTLGIIVLVMLVLLGAFVLFVKSQSSKDSESSNNTTVDEYVAGHGEPVDAIVMDVTRSNELAAVVLVYDNDIIVDGKPIPRDTITGVSFYNAANPYVNSEYMLVISTSRPEHPTVETPIGTDARQASDVVTRLVGHLNLS